MSAHRKIAILAALAVLAFVAGSVALRLMGVSGIAIAFVLWTFDAAAYADIAIEVHRTRENPR